MSKTSKVSVQINLPTQISCETSPLHFTEVQLSKKKLDHNFGSLQARSNKTIYSNMNAEFLVMSFKTYAIYIHGYARCFMLIRIAFSFRCFASWLWLP